MRNNLVKVTCAVGLACSLAPRGLAAEADVRKLFSVGDRKFGGGGTQYAKDRLTTNQYELALGAEASAYLLGLQLPLASAESSFAIPNVGIDTRSSGHLTLFSKPIVKWSNELLSGNSTFRTPPTLARQAGGSGKFSIGPVGVRLKTQAELSTYAEGSQTIVYSTRRPPEKNLAAGPRADASAGGEMEVDAIVAGAGLKAQLRVVGAGVTGRAKVLPRTDGRPPQCSWTITGDLRETHGKIEGWVRVGRGWLSKKWDKTFASYTGGPRSEVLSRGTR
jgi:hypothetical protein